MTKREKAERYALGQLGLKDGPIHPEQKRFYDMHLRGHQSGFNDAIDVVMEILKDYSDDSRIMLVEVERLMIKVKKLKGDE